MTTRTPKVGDRLTFYPCGSREEEFILVRCAQLGLQCISTSTPAMHAVVVSFGRYKHGTGINLQVTDHRGRSVYVPEVKILALDEARPEDGVTEFAHWPDVDMAPPPVRVAGYNVQMVPPLQIDLRPVLARLLHAAQAVNDSLNTGDYDDSYGEAMAQVMEEAETLLIADSTAALRREAANKDVPAAVLAAAAAVREAEAAATP